MEVVITPSCFFPSRSAMAFSSRSFETGGRTMPNILYFQRQQLSVAKKSKVSSTSRLSTSILCYAEHRGLKPTRRRNRLREKLVKQMPKPQIVIDGSNIDLEKFDSNEETESNQDKTEKPSIEINVDEEGSELSRVEPEFVNEEGFKELEQFKDFSSEGLGLKNQVRKMWDEWKDWSEQSQKDFRKWGVGNGPIFLVNECGDGWLKVSINEKEINNRFGALPFPGDYPNEAKTLLGDKLAEAKRVAREIEMGLLKPPRNSKIYEIVGSYNGSLEERRLLGSYELSRVSSVIGPAQQKPRVLPIVLCGLLLAWVAWEYMFYNDPMEEESDEDKVRVEEEVKEVGVVDLNLRNERVVEEMKKQEFGVKDTDGFKNRVLSMHDMAKQGLAFCAIILENLRLRFDKAQARKEQRAMRRRVEFQKRIIKIQDFAGQGLSFLALVFQNKNVPTKKQVVMRPASMDGVQFENRIVEIQGMARQVRVMEQNGSQVPVQLGKDYTKSKTAGRDVDDQRSEEWALNSSVLRKNVPESRPPYASDLNVVPGKVEASSQDNIHVRSIHSSELEEVELKESLQESATRRTSDQPEMDNLQGGQTCVERDASNASKETMNGLETEKVVGDRREHGGETFSFKGPPRIEPQVLVLVKEAMEILASKSSAERDAYKATKETVNAPQTEKDLGDKKRFGGKRSVAKRPHRVKSQAVRHVKDAREIFDFKNSTETMNVPLTEKGLGKETGGNGSPAKGLHKIKSKRTKRENEPREISASKNGKHCELEENSILSSTRTVLMQPTVTKKNCATTKEETSSNRRMVREKRKKLNPVVRKVDSDLKGNIARGKALENVSTNLLETASDMVKMDGVGNTSDFDSSLQEAEELEWMRDEVLRKIVSKVQENDLAGREPFNGLVSEEELLFFKGLERKHEREGEGVKMWIKERVDNLKYGKELS